MLREAQQLDEDDELASALRVVLLRDTTRGGTAGHLPGLFQLRLRGNPQGGRFDPVRIHDMPARPYDAPPADERFRLHVGDIVLQLNDHRVTAFRSLDAVLEFIRQQGRVLEVHVSATRRGEDPVPQPRRFRNAGVVHHMEAFLVQALASVYKRKAVTMDERRQAVTAGVSWGRRRSFLGLFAFGPSGWYDTLEVRIRRLYSVQTPRQHSLDGVVDGGGESSSSRGRAHANGASGFASQPLPGREYQHSGGGFRSPQKHAATMRPPRSASLEASGASGWNGGLGGLLQSAGGANGLFSELLREEDAVWLELECTNSGCRHESMPLSINASGSFSVDVREDVLMPVLPFGDTLQLTLWGGKQHLINSQRGGGLEVGKRKERQLGSCTLPISFADMKEATACDWPNVALIGPNGGEVIGYLQLKMSYRSHSNLGRNDAATTIQLHYRRLLLRRREARRRERAEASQMRVARARQRHRDRKLLWWTRFVQDRWRHNRGKQQQILRQLSAFVEHDKALLRKPLRLCLESMDTRDVRSPWGARLLLYGELDAIESLQLLFCPPKDVFYRSFAAARKAVRDMSAMPHWVASHVPKLASNKTEALLDRSRTALAIQRASQSENVRNQGDDATSVTLANGRARQPESAYQALMMGLPLPLTKVVDVRVYNYSDVRLKLSLASEWLHGSSTGHPPTPSTLELIVQAHSSAAMLVWLEVLKVGTRGEWRCNVQPPPTGRHMVRALPKARLTAARGAPSVERESVGEPRERASIVPSLLKRISVKKHVSLNRFRRRSRDGGATDEPRVTVLRE